MNEQDVISVTVTYHSRGKLEGEVKCTLAKGECYTVTHCSRCINLESCHRDHSLQGLYAIGMARGFSSTLFDPDGKPKSRKQP